MRIKFEEAIAHFAASAASKLTNPVASGQPEHQPRSPLEQLLKELAGLSGHTRSLITSIDEAGITDLKIRPDFAVTADNLQVAV